MELLRLARATIGCVIAATAMVCTGCARTHVTFAPEQDHNTLEQTEFAHLIVGQPMVTFDQVCRAVLLLVDGDEEPRSFEERVSALRSRGIVRDSWAYGPELVVDRGILAYMIFRACEMEGSVNSRLSGWTGVGSERYALKDVVRAGIMRYGLPYQIPTGGEVMRIIARADDYRAGRGLYDSVEKEIRSPNDVE